jgi:hypothetical protein
VRCSFLSFVEAGPRSNAKKTNKRPRRLYTNQLPPPSILSMWRLDYSRPPHFAHSGSRIVRCSFLSFVEALGRTRKKTALHKSIAAALRSFRCGGWIIPGSLGS